MTQRDRIDDLIKDIKYGVFKFYQGEQCVLPLITLLLQAEKALNGVITSGTCTLLNGSVRVYYLSNNTENEIKEAISAIESFRKGETNEKA